MTIVAAFRIQALPDSDIVPRWRSFDDREAAFAAARGYVGKRGWHHVQVLDHHGEVLWDVLNEPQPCPDGGACHHECAERYRGACWRVWNAEPLTIAGWGDRWPDEVVRQEQAKLTTKEVTMDHAEVEFYEDSAGEHRWRLKARNGQILADSGEGYSDEAGAVRGFVRTVNAAVDAHEHI